MKAIVQRAYGDVDVLAVEDIDAPAIRDDEVLVRVHAASVHPDVWHVLRGQPRILRLMGAGLRTPKHPVPGTDLAGRVEAVGKNVTRFLPGDEVLGETLRGYQWTNGGAFAEYAAAPEFALEHKPANIAFDRAAAVPTSGIIALSNLRHGRLRPGHEVLINGAGGGVGTLALQIAKAEGAVVTAVDRAGKLDMLRSIGADHVIDCTREDFTRGGERYDLVFDIPGSRPFGECRRALRPGGMYVLIGHDHYGSAGRSWLGSIPRFMKLAALTPFVKQLPKLDVSMPNKRAAMTALKELIETGKLNPVVDRTFPLSEVPAAIRHLQTGNVCGKVVVTV